MPGKKAGKCSRNEKGPLAKPTGPSKNAIAAKLSDFKARMLAITKDTRIALLHDTDADGICSGVLLAKGIERLRGKPIDEVVYQPHKNIGIAKETAQRCKKLKIDILFTVDKAVDEERELLENASLFFKVVCIDHHPSKSDVTDEFVLVIKSQMVSDIDGDKYPASKLVLDLFSPLVDVSDLDWISAAGLIGDSGYKSWTDFVDKTLQKYGIPQKKDIFDTDLGLVARYVSSAVLVDSRNVKEAFDILMESGKPKDVLCSKLKEYDGQIDKELQFWVSEHKKRAKFFPEYELIFYVVSPKFPLNSPLSTILSQKYYPTSTLVVVHDSGESILGVSIRRQDYKVDCPSLVKAACAGLKDASGGGHIPAAGGKVRREDLDRFLENIKSEIASGRHRMG